MLKALLSTPLSKWWRMAVLIAVVDQISKLWILTHLQLGEVVPVLPGLNLTLAYNRGAAFGWLADQPGWQRTFFILLTLAMSVVLFLWRQRLTTQAKVESLGLACILGGAWGNVYDRIMYGFVVDFIDCYVDTWHWFTFNIADTAICLGATLVIATSLLVGSRAKVS